MKGITLSILLCLSGILQAQIYPVNAKLENEKSFSMIHQICSQSAHIRNYDTLDG